MSDCFITSVNKNIIVYFDDIIPYAKVEVFNEGGATLINKEYRNIHNLLINEKLAYEGYLIVRVNTGTKRFKKRLYFKKINT